MTQTKKKDELSLKTLVDRLLGELTHPLYVLEEQDKLDGESVIQARGKLDLTIDLLVYLFDHGYPFTKTELQRIADAKKALYPSIHKKDEKILV